MTKQRYEITQRHQDALSDACNPKAYLAMGAVGSFDIVARAAAAWAAIGAEMGFDPATVEMIQGAGVSSVMATPSP